jgi:O-antigen ligase
VERFTKIAVTLWTCAAIALQVRLLHSSWRELPWLAIVAAVAMMVLTRIDRRTIALVLAAAYVFPVLVRYMRGLQSTYFSVLWLAALVGAMLPDLLTTPWRIPIRWRPALVFSALAVVTGATIVLWREVDGMPLALTNLSAADWRGGTPPQFTLRWLLYVALTLVTGILWFDWLFGAADLDFERVVITPLVFGALALALASTYQVVVDAGVWNETVFRALGRATGTMYDANVAGTLAALWSGGVVLWAIRLRGWRIYLAPVVVAASWIAIWGSGSRTALAAGLLIAAGGAIGLLVNTPRRWVWWLVGAGGLAAILLLSGAETTIRSIDPNASNPIARAWKAYILAGSAPALADELWTRNGYGAAAATMIQEYPIAGIGVGAFHGMVTDVIGEDGRRLPPDNAQNWLRHQISELGLLGALGWIVWFVTFAFFVCIPRRDEPGSIWMIRSMLVGFGVASMLGMPGQHVMVAITFWTLAFWYVRLSGTAPSARAIGRWTWGAMGLALALFAAVSVSLAASTLRPPERARRAGEAFSYGYAPAETTGEDAGYHRVQSRAVTVVDERPGWLAVSVRLQDRGAARPPLDVKVWRDGEIVLKAQLTDRTPVSGFIQVGASPGRIVLETSAREPGMWQWWPSTADPGLLMKWEFVDVAPSRFRGYAVRPGDGG